MILSTPSETAARKNLAKLQRAIVDGLQDVKAQDIQVFDTGHLSPLFERVIVASGSSNRQTKALAASVRDAVREAGFVKPRTEGEDNGEWIIVDCGAAVAHIMQPAIRQYYRLEELWGDKPVRIALGAAKPSSGAAPPAADPKPTREAAAKAPARKTAAKTPARKMAATTATKPAVKAPAKTAARPAGPVAKKKAAIKTIVVKPPGANKPAAKVRAAAQSGGKRTAARKGQTSRP